MVVTVPLVGLPISKCEGAEKRETPEELHLEDVVKSGVDVTVSSGFYMRVSFS